MRLATNFEKCHRKGEMAMKRTCPDAALCPVARSLEAVGDWWSLLILRDAFFGKRRFGEFLESLGVARNILTVRLKKLVAHGILEHAQDPLAHASAEPEGLADGKAVGVGVLLDVGENLRDQSGSSLGPVLYLTGRPGRRQGASVTSITDITSL